MTARCGKIGVTEYLCQNVFLVLVHELDVLLAKVAGHAMESIEVVSGNHSEILPQIFSTPTQANEHVTGLTNQLYITFSGYNLLGQ